jgi:hypothetical protein
MCGACLTCPAGWSCFDFSNYNGGIRPTWSPDAPDKSCLPDGIVSWTQGHASDNGQFGAPAGTGSGTSGSGGIGLDGNPERNGGAGSDTTTTTSGTGQPSSTTPFLVSPVPPSQGGAIGNAGGEASASAHSSGCAYGGGAGQRGLWLVLAMTGLVARLARRRNRAR